ncbi:MAG: DUF2088 domain-containing protein [Actinobacteria bacterium]|nr:DUF2088 domain-containing protein [Actinomycetota bacterium]
MTAAASDLGLPPMRLVRQTFDRAELTDFEAVLAAKVRARLAALGLAPGARIAIGVGSRGISPIAAVVRTLLAELEAAGAAPFIVPAMGSHGGGTAEGQARVLAGYGIDSAHLGVPVVATMDTVVLGRSALGAEVHLSAAAHAVDGVVVIGRVKPHTSFRGTIESGLCKMLAIGLGNRRGAEAAHAHPLAAAIPAAAQVALARAKVIFGVAVVENAFDRPCALEVVAPEDFPATDARLLARARAVLPRVPLDRLDVLIVDRMGKNISGTGMDPNVIGMWRRLPELPHEPDYRWVVALGLTPESHGNATGVGMADLVSQKLVAAIDATQMTANVLTSMALAMAKVPLTLPSDRACVAAALDLARRASARAPRVVRIANTLQLETFWASAAVLPDLPSTCMPVEAATPFAFQAGGAIVEDAAFHAREPAATALGR